MSGLGAFASGLGSGFVTGRELSMREAAAKQAKEKWNLEKPALELQANRARRMAQLYGVTLPSDTRDAALNTQPSTTRPQTPAAAAALVGTGIPSARGATAPSAPTGGAKPPTPKQSFDAEQRLLRMGDKAVMLGLPDQAIKLYTAANHVGKIHFDDQLDKAVKGALASGSPDALVKFYNKEINDGGTATVDKAKDGSYTVKFWHENGALASTMQFKNLDGMINRAAELGGYDQYAQIKAGELTQRLKAVQAQAALTRANAAETSSEASVRRAGAAQTNAAASQRRADAEQARADAERSRADAQWYAAQHPKQVPLTDAGKWDADLAAHRVTPQQYDAHFAAEGRATEAALRKEAIAAYHAAYPRPDMAASAGGEKVPSLTAFVADYIKGATGKTAAPGTAGNLNAQPGSQSAPLEMPTSKAQMVTGKWYNTARGLARWDGTQFVQPAPGAAGTLATLPTGSRQIGTSNGRPVYEAPDGTRYVRSAPSQNGRPERVQ